jgi:hypothetical protein
MESLSGPLPLEGPGSCLTFTNISDNFKGPPIYPRTNPSSDNLNGYATPSNSSDSQSSMGASLQSPAGSSTNLIFRHLDGIETPHINSSTSTSISDRKRPMRCMCRVVRQKRHPEPPYHVFPRTKKKMLMYLAAIVGMFSSLSANIYFPALGQISRVNIYVHYTNVC